MSLNDLLHFLKQPGFLADIAEQLNEVNSQLQLRDKGWEEIISNLNLFTRKFECCELIFLNKKINNVFEYA